ncbi:MAG: hypothetical protein JWQ67_2704, partial [Marmoricola sp.]|nr:hypothetical protein [Marmoricola sp.]
LRWHHARRGSTSAELDRDRRRLVQWRQDNELDLAAVIRLKRSEGW